MALFLPVDQLSEASDGLEFPIASDLDSPKSIPLDIHSKSPRSRQEYKTCKRAAYSLQFY